MTDLTGRVAIVLGASGARGMGQAMARRFHNAGAKVIVAGRKMKEMEDFAKEIDGAAFPCDIANKADSYALAKFALDKFGRLDVAVNSTGLPLGAPFLEFGEEALERILQVMFKGPFYFFQAMVDAMLKAGNGGSIIEISSGTATRTGTVASYEAYMAAKAGIDHLLRALANQYGANGIRFNSIVAGHTDTGFSGNIHGLNPVRAQAFNECYPLGRYGTSEDVAVGALFLADPECFMTGDMLQINGGLNLRRNPLPPDFGRIEKELAEQAAARSAAE